MMVRLLHSSSVLSDDEARLKMPVSWICGYSMAVARSTSDTVAASSRSAWRMSGRRWSTVDGSPMGTVGGMAGRPASGSGPVQGTRVSASVPGSAPSSSSSWWRLVATVASAGGICAWVRASWLRCWVASTSLTRPPRALALKMFRQLRLRLHVGLQHVEAAPARHGGQSRRGLLRRLPSPGCRGPTRPGRPRARGRPRRRRGWRRTGLPRSCPGDRACRRRSRWGCRRWRSRRRARRCPMA